MQITCHRPLKSLFFGSSVKRCLCKSLFAGPWNYSCDFPIIVRAPLMFVWTALSNIYLNNHYEFANYSIYVRLRKANIYITQNNQTLILYILTPSIPSIVYALIIEELFTSVNITKIITLENKLISNGSLHSFCISYTYVCCAANCLLGSNRIIVVIEVTSSSEVSDMDVCVCQVLMGDVCSDLMQLYQTSGHSKYKSEILSVQRRPLHGHQYFFVAFLILWRAYLSHTASTPQPMRQPITI